MRPVPAVSREQFGVFTTEQALPVGWTISALRYATRRSRLERVRHGVYALPSESTGDPAADAPGQLRRQAVAISITNRRVPISHGAAALIHGMSLARTPERVCVTYPRGRRDAIPGAHRHRGTMAQGDVVRCGRVLLLSPARTVVDVGCESGSDDAIVAADSALRLRLASRDELIRALHAARGWPGVRAAALPIQLADARAESALESISRLRIVVAGLPTPQLQVTIGRDDGRFVARVDFYWDEFGVIGEADGMGKYGLTPYALREEKIRQGVLEDSGLIVVRWGWADLWPFDRAAERLRAAFARGLRPDRAPRRWTAAPAPAWPRQSVVDRPD